MKDKDNQQGENPKDYEKIQLSLNTELYSIFAPARSTIPLPRVYSKEIIVNGHKKISNLIVGKKGDKSDLTRTEYQIYCFFCKKWDEQGRPWSDDKPESIKVYFSCLELLDFLNLSHGKSDYKWLEEKLLNCKVVPIIFENAFYITKDEFESERRVVQLFSDLSIYKQEREAEIFDDIPNTNKRSWVVIHPAFLKNLVNKVHKPLLYYVYDSIKSEVGKAIYRYIDLPIYGTYKYHKDLFDFALDCNISIEQQLWNLKNTIQKGLNELVGIRLTSGIVLRAKVVKSKSRSGFKVLIIKGKLPEQLKALSGQAGAEADNNHLSQDPNRRKNELKETEHYLTIYESFSKEDKAKVDKRVEELIIKSNNNKLPEKILPTLKNIYIKQVLMDESYK